MPSPDRPSHLRVAPAISDSDYQSQLVTNERTNGRTPEVNNDSDILQLSDVRARVEDSDDGVVSFAAVLEAGFMPTGERFPIKRVGKRGPLPYHVRAAVWIRDRGICQKCKADNPKPWELDHIIPWSAGGSDSSDNLRVLCQQCNQERGNYDDGTTFAKSPVTWWCHRCYVDPIRWDYTWPLGVYCPTHRHDGNSLAPGCSVERIYRWERDEKPTWHKRAPIEAATIRAFCAHCNAPGMTDVTL